MFIGLTQGTVEPDKPLCSIACFRDGDANPSQVFGQLQLRRRSYGEFPSAGYLYAKPARCDGNAGVVFRVEPYIDVMEQGRRPRSGGGFSSRR
jgi:hypothetical protein